VPISAHSIAGQPAPPSIAVAFAPAKPVDVGVAELPTLFDGIAVVVVVVVDDDDDDDDDIDTDEAIELLDADSSGALADESWFAGRVPLSATATLSTCIVAMLGDAASVFLRGKRIENDGRRSCVDMCTKLSSVLNGQPSYEIRRKYRCSSGSVIR
jgi:hypothetical protein